jgi:hypothetical protein
VPRIQDSGVDEVESIKKTGCNDAILGVEDCEEDADVGFAIGYSGD